jgi:hypothetical protein
MNISSVTAEVFETELPFHFGGEVFDIRVATLIEKGEPTGKYRPVITVKNQPISHGVERADSVEEAHFAAIKWIRTAYAT